MISTLTLALIAVAPAALFLIIDGIAAWVTRSRPTTGAGKAILVMPERRAAA